MLAPCWPYQPLCPFSCTRVAQQARKTIRKIGNERDFFFVCLQSDTHPRLLTLTSHFPSFSSLAAPLITVAICVSCLNYFVTLWKLQRLDHRCKGWSGRISRSWQASFSYLLWLAVSLLSQWVSLVGLALVLYAEVFVDDLNEEGVKWSWSFLPIIALIAAFPISTWMHHKLIADVHENAYKTGHAFLSALFPLR